MISLALNIAAMGFVLVAGIVASLKGGVAGTIGDAALRRLAQEIASGRTDGLHEIAPALAQADPARGVARGARARVRLGDGVRRGGRGRARDGERGGVRAGRRRAPVCE